MASAKKPRDEAPPPSPETLSEAAGVSTGTPLTPSTPAAEETKRIIESANEARAKDPELQAALAANEKSIMEAFAEKSPGMLQHPELPKLGPQVRRYRVWSHGTLHRDGVVYKPGEELDLREDVAKDICCLELVT